MSVVTSGHDVADARLHREVAALQRRGLTVAVHGLGEPGGGPPGCTVLTQPRGSLLARALRAARLPWQATGRVVMVIDPDSALTAWPVCRLRRRPLVVDVHEDYAALLADRAWARGLTGRVARRLVDGAGVAARRCDLTVVADEHVPPARARRRLVLRNLPDVTHLPVPSAPGPVPRALYIGDLRASRGLFAMLDAIEAAPEWSLDLVGPVAEADRPELDRRLATEALAGRVWLHGRRPPAEAWQLARGAWVGLALLQDTPAFRRALPSKLYEYVACGLPILVSDLPRMVEFSTASGSGRVVPAGDGAAAAAVLRSWSADPDGYAGERERAARAAGQVSGHAEYEEFAAAIAALLPG